MMNPNQSSALGLVETRGLAGALTAADAMLKAAAVTLAGKAHTGGGIVTVMIRGSLEAVSRAVEAGACNAAAAGELICTQVIANPHEALSVILPW